MAELYVGSVGSYYAGNVFLTDSEMKTNANYIYRYLSLKGWSRSAVAGMLGNMETESTINPAIWQNLNPVESNGYGLVQWTPSTNYTLWCTSEGLNPERMDSALARIEYELANGLQWIATDDYPLSFAEFKVSNESPEYLAQAFLRNYERPADQNQPARSTQARKWYSELTGDSPITPPSAEVKTKKMPFILLWAAARRR